MNQQYRLNEVGAKAQAQKQTKARLSIIIIIIAIMTVLQIYLAEPEERGVVIGASIFTLLIFWGIVLLLIKALTLFFQNMLITADDKDLTYEVEPLTTKHNLLIRYMYKQLHFQSGSYKRLSWKDLDAIKETKLHLLVKGTQASNFTGKDIIYLPYELENFEALRATIDQHLQEEVPHND